MTKKNLTDLGPGHCLSLNEVLEGDEVTERNQHSESRLHQPRADSVGRSKYNSTHLSNTLEEDATTIFDLVHRDRQRQQQHREIQKFSNDRSRQVLSPKIMSPMCVNVTKNSCFAYETSGLNTSGIMQNSSQNYLLGRKHLSNTQYRSVSGSNRNKHYIRSKDRKKALREFNKEVQSAVLPDIGSALTCSKSRSLKNKLAVTQLQNERNSKELQMEECNSINITTKSKK